MKPSNFPTQGRPNPRKILLKLAFGPLHTENIVSWVRIGFMQETDNEKPNRTKFSANTLFLLSFVLQVVEYTFCLFPETHYFPVAELGAVSSA